MAIWLEFTVTILLAEFTMVGEKHMKRTCLLLVVLGLPAFVAQPVAAGPQLFLQGNHLGAGLVQYSFEVFNDFGGNVAAQISVTGNINHVPTAFFPDVFPNGGADLQSQADLADMLDPGYIAAGGKAADSWWDDQFYSTANLPFGGALGGAIGSNLFQYSAQTSGLIGPNVTFLGQIVIFDPVLLTFPYPTGLAEIVTRGPMLAPISIIDPVPSDPTQNSVLAAGGQPQSIVGTFGLFIPEPSSAALAGLGLLALLTYRPIRRRPAWSQRVAIRST